MQKSMAWMSAAEIIAILQPQPPKPRRSREYLTRAADVLSLLRYHRKHKASSAFWREHDAALIEQWNDGNSGGVIAERFGINRITVVGRVFFLRSKGIYMRSDPPRTNLRGKPRKKRSKKNG